MKPPNPTTNSPVQEAWWRCPGFVYFFGAGIPIIAVKIGVAAIPKGKSLRDAVQRRLKQIQTSNHEPVQLLGLIRFSEGEHPTREADAFERRLHIRFADLQRFAQHTRAAEWFTAAPELMSYIERETEKPEALGAQRSVCSPIAQDC